MVRFGNSGMRLTSFPGISISVRPPRGHHSPNLFAGFPPGSRTSFFWALSFAVSMQICFISSKTFGQDNGLHSCRTASHQLPRHLPDRLPLLLLVTAPHVGDATIDWVHPCENGAQKMGSGKRVFPIQYALDDRRRRWS